MRSVRVIPCLDVDCGRVVKGVRFVDLRDAGDPAELAARYDAEGADEVVFLDITASSGGRDTMLDVVRRCAEEVFIPLTVGGGIRSVEDARRMLRAGADKVGVNTAAVQRPELVAEIAREFGAQCVVVAIDARRVAPAGPEAAAAQSEAIRDGSPSGAPASRRQPSGKPAGPEAAAAQSEAIRFEVCTHGGRTPTGIDAVEWAARVEALGAGEILLTSMDRDGTRDGYDLELTRAVVGACNIPVVASGGVGSLDHLVAGAVDGGADAVLAASIFHFGEHTVAEAKARLAAAGVTVRPVPPAPR